MTSDTTPPDELYVWVWLPGESEPVVCGRIAREDGPVCPFNYGRSFLQRADAISIYTPELPLRAGEILPQPPLSLANCLRDSAPDAWGRRVIINRLTGMLGDAAAQVELDELTFLLESGSDRIGALDFQLSPTVYVPRQQKNAKLDELIESADRVDQGVSLTPDLALALQHGTAVGGARPKALIETDDRKYIAKFSSSSDTYNMVKAEYVAMQLANELGLDVAPVQLTQAMEKDVLLVERFDREKTESGWTRRIVVSGLTLLGLHELYAAHASYSELAETLRHRFSDPKKTLAELFSRLTLNILVGNTDDHARNHAAFWDGKTLSLTKAYDICPQTRSGIEASQGMLIDGTVRRSQLLHCVNAANHFLLHRDDAVTVMLGQVKHVAERWDDVCREAGVSAVDKSLMWRRQFINPLALEGMEGEFGSIIANL